MTFRSGKWIIITKSQREVLRDLILVFVVVNFFFFGYKIGVYQKFEFTE